MAPTPSFVAPGILPYQAIIRLCGLAGNQRSESDGTQGPIRPCLRENVRTASYDLRLGGEFLLHDLDEPSYKVAPRQLAKGESVVLAPDAVVFVSVLEMVHLPSDLVGHVSLKMDLLRQGLLMGSQSQIDAGYRGQIFALLYNLSDVPVSVQYGESLIRLELTRLPETTEAPYDGDYQDTPLGEAIKTPVPSALQSMRRRVDAADEKIRNTRWIAAVLATAAIFATAGQTYCGSVDDAKQRISKLEGEVETLRRQPPVSGERSQRTAEILRALENDLAKLRCQIRAQEQTPMQRNQC